MEKKSNQKGTSGRTNNWTCIVYQDSLPSDWISQLEETAIQVCISPLHDMDVWTKKDEKNNPKHVAGAPKKPHRHVVIMYGDGNKKSLEQVQEDFGFLNGTDFKRVLSKVGMIQYLDHRFCRTKHHYDERDVISLNGFNYEDVVNVPTDKEIDIACREIRAYICDKNIIEFCDIQDVCDEQGETSVWFKAIKVQTYQICKYIDSKRNKFKDAEKEKEKEITKQLNEVKKLKAELAEVRKNSDLDTYSE